MGKEPRKVKIRLKARLQAYTHGAIPNKMSMLENDVPFLALDRIMTELSSEERRRGRISLGIVDSEEIGRIVTVVEITKDMFTGDECVIDRAMHRLNALYGASVHCYIENDDRLGLYEYSLEAITLDVDKVEINIGSILPWNGYIQIIAPMGSAPLPEHDMELIYDTESDELLYDYLTDELLMA
jgi:hypothetical protein